MVTRILNLLKSLPGLAMQGSRLALLGSGTAALYFGASTLLATILLSTLLAYKWGITPEKLYKAYAMLRGDDITEMQEAAAEHIAGMGYDKTLEERVKRILDEGYHRESAQQIDSFTLPPEDLKPGPPPPPSTAERIDAYERRIRGDLAKAQAAGLDEETRLLEDKNLDPAQAKEIIRKLWKDDPNRVLTMLLAMSDKRRGEILYAMQQTNAEELKDLCEILQRIGDGEPRASIIKEAAKEP
jgi:hypothetical protein